MLKLFSSAPFLQGGFIFSSVALLLTIFYSLFLNLKNDNLSNDLNVCKSKILLEQINSQTALLMIEEQNNKIKFLKIDNEKLSKKADNQTQSLKKHFLKIPAPAKDDNCSIKLKFYEDTLNELNK